MTGSPDPNHDRQGAFFKLSQQFFIRPLPHGRGSEPVIRAVTKHQRRRLLAVREVSVRHLEVVIHGCHGQTCLPVFPAQVAMAKLPLALGARVLHTIIDSPISKDMGHPVKTWATLSAYAPQV